MARIKDEQINIARNACIVDVWQRLGLPPVRTGKAFNSPFRKDEKPSCQLGGKKNIFYDHATGKSMDTIALVRHVKSCGFARAVAYVLNRRLEELTGNNGSRAHPAARPATDAIETLAKVRGWQPKALHALGAKSRNAQAPREVYFPMRDASGKQIGTRRRLADGNSFAGQGKVKCVHGSKQGLLCPWPFPAESEQPVLVVEGEADAAAALSAGANAVVATPGAQPSKQCLRQLQRLVARRDVVMFPDPDEAGRKWLARVGKVLLNAQCSVRYVPSDGDDLDKQLRQSEAPDKVLAELIQTAVAFKAKKTGSSDLRTSRRKLPEITVNDRQLRHIIADAWTAVHAKNNPAQDDQSRRPFVFQRSGALVRLSDGEYGRQIEPMQEHAVFGILARVADWVRVTDEACINTSPVKDVARDMLAYPDKKLPPLEAVASTPLFGADANLITRSGYHRSERLWFEPEEELQDLKIPASPSAKDIEEARSLLTNDLLVDFPFVDDSDRAHVVAAMLLPFVRRMIDGCTPMHLIEAPAPGSGKGLLSNLVCIVATGKAADGRTLPGQDDEARKMLTAELSRGKPIVLLDNTNDRKKLHSPSLASVITAETWTDRLLGQTAMLTLANRALWLITGNNPALSMEIARRCVRIRIDPQVDRPWQRGGFKHPVIVEWAKQNRCRLVKAVLVLVQAWIDAGRPMSDQRLGSFERWSAVIGGILNVAGIRGFLGSLEDLYESADAEGQMWREFTFQWWEAFADKPLKVAELNDFCQSHSLMDAVRGDGSFRSQETRLGFALSRARDRVFGGLRITRVMKHGKHKGGACYALDHQNPESGPVSMSANGDLWGPFGDVCSKGPHTSNDVKTACYEINGDVGDVEGNYNARARAHARTHKRAYTHVTGPNVPNVPKKSTTDCNTTKKVMGTFGCNVPKRSPKVPMTRNSPIDLALIPDGIEPEEHKPP